MTMQVIVPLAGPDFVRKDGSLKAKLSIDGEPLLKRVLNSRPWAARLNGSDYVFVLMDQAETRVFASSDLATWFPGASITFLSRPTRGAALSALPGLAGFRTENEPLIIDLADILYDSNLNPEEHFLKDDRCGGIALVFQSGEPAYSYLKRDAAGNFVEAAEKKVISEEASAGTYMFRNQSTYLRALAHGLENESTQAFNGLFYVCPLMNGICHQGKTVSLETVSNIIDVKVAPPVG